MSNEHDELLRRLQNLETLLQQQHLAPAAAPVGSLSYCSTNCKADRRKFLNLCPSNLDRRYRAPVLQRSVNAGALTRKFGQQLADVQYRLSGLTRPIDHMAHNLVQGHAPTIADSTNFIRAIHSLLSDVASHITQLRNDNICRDAGLPTVPLAADSDGEDALLDTTRILEQSKLSKALQDAQSKGRTSRKRKGKRNNSSTRATTVESEDQSTRSPDKTNLSDTTSKPTTPSAPRAFNSSSHNSREKKAIEKTHDPGFLSHLFTVPKKTGDLRPVLNLRPLNHSLSISKVSPVSIEERHVSIQDTGIRSISEPDSIHQNPETSLTLGTSEGNKDLCVSRRSDHHCQDQRIEPPPHHSGMSKLTELGFLFKESKSHLVSTQQTCHFRYQPQNPAKSIIVHRESTSNYPSNIPCQIEDSRTIATEESTTSPRDLMQHNDNFNTSSLQQPPLVDQPLDQMERPILFTGDTDSRSIHRCIEQRMGHCTQQSGDEWNMDTRGIDSTHQLTETSSHMEVCEDETTLGSGTRSPALMELATTIWNTCLRTNTRLHLTYIPSAINPADSPSRQMATQIEWKLEMGPPSAISKCIPDLMESMEESFSMSTLESSSTMPPTSESTPNQSNNNHAELAVCNLVPFPFINDQGTTSAGAIHHDSPQPSRRRPIHEESTMGTSSMEYKRQRLELNGYDDNALAIFLNPEAQPSIQRYNPIQQQFIRWCELHRFNAYNPDPAQIINYLAYVHLTLHWQVATCLNYKSAILALYDQPARQQIQNDSNFTRFFTNLRALTVRSFDRPNYDLTPVLDKLHSWGPNDLLTAERLTRKLCFLLAITGFLHHADLHHCPKEKRGGSPIERVVFINQHPDPLLCPVLVYQAYVTRITTTPCLGPHPTRPSRTIGFLVQSLHDFNSPVSVQTISRHVRSLLTRITMHDDSGQRRSPPRARAVGSSNAVLHGANLDDILVHGSWTSACVFDNYGSFK
ncbi:hypothetical protein G6F37_009292 [Rhizopus arrhizus]|nr:hypothetical protein G6F37_009292 [Rhizopus arrhizus]